MSTSSFTTEDGCVLAYEDVGEGLPVLWQHGLGADRSQPAEVFPSIVGIRRITVECRGHGHSQLGDPARLSIAQFAHDAEGLFNHLRIRKAIVGGISMGAAVSMRLAVNLPSRVKGLIIARPAWTSRAAPVSMEPFLLVASLLHKFGAAEGMRRFLNTEIYAEVERISPDNANSLCNLFSRADMESTIQLLSRIPKDGPGLSRQEITAISTPTLVIGNAEDFIHPLQYAIDLAAWISGADLQIITSKSVSRELYLAQFRESLAKYLSTGTSPQ